MLKGVVIDGEYSQIFIFLCWHTYWNSFNDRYSGNTILFNKTVYLDIKSAKDYNEYYKDFYKKLYDRDYEKLKDEYEFKLKSKSIEYFKKFYDEEMVKKKEEQNGNEV